MLAYQPVRSLATLNIVVQQGLAGARRVIPVIDDIPEIKDQKDSKALTMTGLIESYCQKFIGMPI